MPTAGEKKPNKKLHSTKDSSSSPSNKGIDLLSASNGNDKVAFPFVVLIS